MRNLLTKKRGNTPARATGAFVAVDFDRATLRIVEARPTGGRCEVTRMVLAPMPDQLNLLDGAAVGGVLAKALKDASVRASTLVMAVPRAQAVLKPLSLPRTADMGELASMVLLQLDGQLPFPNEEAVIDFAAGAHDDAETARPGASGASNPTSDKRPGESADAAGGAQMEVLAAAVQQTLVARYHAIAAAAGLKLACLTLRPYANAACLATLFPVADQTVALEPADPSTQPPREPSDRIRALVTLGSEEVETTILADGHVIFSRSATLPATGAAVPVDAATSQTLRALQSYQALHPDKRVASIFIAGGTGFEAELSRRVADVLKLKVSLLEPQRAMQLPGIANAATDGQGGGGAQAFTSALGLALAFVGADANFLPFNFIDPKRPAPPDQSARSRRVLVMLTAATAVFCAFALGAMSLSAKRAEVERLDRELAAVAVDAKRVASLGKRLDAIDKWKRQTIDPLTHWANLSALMPPAQDAFINMLRTDNEGRIIFAARARNQQVVDTFAPRFTEHGYIFAPGSVATRGDSPDAPGYSFVTDIKVTPGSKQKIDVASLTAPPRPADDINAPPPAPKDHAATPLPANNDDRNKPQNADPTTGGNRDENRERWRKGKGGKGGGQ